MSEEDIEANSTLQFSINSEEHKEEFACAPIQSYDELKQIHLEKFNNLSGQLVILQEVMQLRFTHLKCKFTETANNVNNFAVHDNNLKEFEEKIRSFNRQFSIKVKNLKQNEDLKHNYHKFLKKVPKVINSYENIDEMLGSMIQTSQEQIISFENYNADISKQYSQGKDQLKKTLEQQIKIFAKLENNLTEEQEQQLQQQDFFFERQQSVADNLTIINQLLLQDYLSTTNKETAAPTPCLIKEIYTEITCDPDMWISPNFEEDCLTIRHSSETVGYIETFVLCKDKIWKLQLSLLNNGGYQNWNNTSFFLVEKDIQRTDYQHLSNELQENIFDKQFYGIQGEQNLPLNLQIILQSNKDFCQLEKDKIEIEINQKNSSLILKSNNFMYKSNKLVKDLEYRLVIKLGNKNAELQMKISN